MWNFRNTVAHDMPGTGDLLASWIDLKEAEKSLTNIEQYIDEARKKRLKKY